jgi:hypothetical protein
MDVEKMKANRDVRGLITALKNEDKNVRRAAAMALRQIGDVKTIKPLLISLYPPDRNQNVWDYYDPLVPVIAEALTSIGKAGKAGVEQLIKVVKDRTDVLLYGAPAVWALCEIEDRKATEAVVDWIFWVGAVVPAWEGAMITFQEKPISPPDLIRRIVPPAVLPKLLGEYTDLILDIFAWRPTTDLEQWDVSRCNEAIQRLCMTNTPVSSNILHKVAKVGGVSVSSQWGTGFHTLEYLDFKSQRQKAKDELKRRGNPRYDPSAYLNQDAWRL